MSRDYKCEIEINGLEKHEAHDIEDALVSNTQVADDDVRVELEYNKKTYRLRSSSNVTLSGGVSEKEFADFMIRWALYEAKENHPVQVRLTCMEDLPFELYSASQADFDAAKEQKAEDEAEDE